MTHYNTWNVKFSNSQLNQLKSAKKSGTKVTLSLTSNVVGDSLHVNNFSHKILLTNTQVSKICKAFANGSSANIKFWKTQLSKLVRSEESSGRLLGPLLKTGFSFNWKCT